MPRCASGTLSKTVFDDNIKFMTEKHSRASIINLKQISNIHSPINWIDFRFKKNGPSLQSKVTVSELLHF